MAEHVTSRRTAVISSTTAAVKLFGVIFDYKPVTLGSFAGH